MLKHLEIKNVGPARGMDLEGNEVALRRRDFEKHGDAATWLLSEAFDLKSSHALKYEKLTDEAAKLFEQDNPAPTRVVE